MTLYNIITYIYIYIYIYTHIHILSSLSLLYWYSSPAASRGITRNVSYGDLATISSTIVSDEKYVDLNEKEQHKTKKEKTCQRGKFQGLFSEIQCGF